MPNALQHLYVLCNNEHTTRLLTQRIKMRLKRPLFEKEPQFLRYRTKGTGFQSTGYVYNITNVTILAIPVTTFKVNTERRR